MTNNTPKLRFPGFTDEWQVKKLGEIARLERGRFSPRPRNDPRYYGGEIPFVQTGDVVKSSGVISQYSQTLNEDGLKVSKLFPKDTILITIAANIGHTGILARDMACPDSLIGIGCNESMSPVFLNYYLSTQQKQMDNIAAEAAQKNINIEFLKPYPVPTTRMDEQQKVAGFLMVVDEKIASLEQKADKLEAYKRGVMQKIFTQKICFTDNEGQNYPDWQTKKLGELGKFYRGLSYDKTNVQDVGNLVLRSSNIQDGKLILDHDLQFVNKNIDEKIRLVNGDIVICMANGSQALVGKSAIYQGGYNSGLTVGAFCSIFRSENILAHHILETSQYAKCLKMLLAGTNISNLKNSDLSELSFMLPQSSEESQKIADFLSAVDEKIELTRATLEKTKEFKKSLLQRMFV